MSRWAMAAPIPREPPVTRARRPANSFDKSRTEFGIFYLSPLGANQTARWVNSSGSIGTDVGPEWPDADLSSYLRGKVLCPSIECPACRFPAEAEILASHSPFPTSELTST